MKLKSLIACLSAATLPMTSGAFTVSMDPIGLQQLTNRLPTKKRKEAMALLGRTSGHEEITRQALLLGLATAKNSLPGILSEKTQYPFTTLEQEIFTTGLQSYMKGTQGFRTPNPVIRGNHSNDIVQTVNTKMVPEYLTHLDFLKNRSSLALENKAKNKILDPNTLKVRSFWMWYNLESPFAHLPEAADKKADRIDEVKRNMGGNWDYNYEFQTAHSLRDTYTDKKGKITGVWSARATCERTRSYINNLAILSVKNLEKAQGLAKQGNIGNAKDYIYQAFFQLGQATHSLQDSFSAAHTQRSGKNYDIQNICVYGDSYKKLLKSNADKVCYHFEYVPDTEGKTGLALLGAYKQKAADTLASYREGAIDDSIWIRGSDDNNPFANNKHYVETKNRWGNREEIWAVGPSESFINNMRSKWSIIKDEARMARAATARYMYVIMEYLSDIRNNYYTDNANYDLLSERLKTRFFEGASLRMHGPYKLVDHGQDNENDLSHLGDYQVPVAPVEDVMTNGVFRCDHLSNEAVLPGT